MDFEYMCGGFVLYALLGFCDKSAPAEPDRLFLE